MTQPRYSNTGYCLLLVASVGRQQPRLLVLQRGDAFLVDLPLHAALDPLLPERRQRVHLGVPRRLAEIRHGEPLGHLPPRALGLGDAVQARRQLARRPSLQRLGHVDQHLADLAGLDVEEAAAGARAVLELQAAHAAAVGEEQRHDAEVEVRPDALDLGRRELGVRDGRVVVDAELGGVGREVLHEGAGCQVESLGERGEDVVGDFLAAGVEGLECWAEQGHGGRGRPAVGEEGVVRGAEVEMFLVPGLVISRPGYASGCGVAYPGVL